MIKKSVFENDLIEGMQRELNKQASKTNTDNLVQAAEYLNSVIDIFEDAGMTVQADKVLNILLKIANDKSEKDQTAIKMDDNKSDDLLNIDVYDDAVDDKKDMFEATFEDE